MSTSVILNEIDQKKIEIQNLYKELKINKSRLDSSELTPEELKQFQKEKDQILFAIYLNRKKIRGLSSIIAQLGWK